MGCIICLGDFIDGDEVVQLPCNHTFHTECIGHWLVKSHRCPLRCPQFVLPPAHWTNMHVSIGVASGDSADPVPTAMVVDVTASDHVDSGRSLSVNATRDGESSAAAAASIASAMPAAPSSANAGTNNIR